MDLHEPEEDGTGSREMLGSFIEDGVPGSSDASESGHVGL